MAIGGILYLHESPKRFCHVNRQVHLEFENSTGWMAGTEERRTSFYE